MDITQKYKLSNTEDSISRPLLSLTIDALRFPLALLVIFIHINPAVVNLINSKWSISSDHGVYNVVCISISHVVAHLAVPTFFLISGLLFFYNFRSWDWSVYKRKIESRLHTLIIPYIVWNACLFLLPAIVIAANVLLKGGCASLLVDYLTSNGLHPFYDISVWGTERTDWFGNHIFRSGPVDVPLWFLRDLILVSICTPAIFLVIKKIKLVGLLLLGIAYISRVWIQTPGFSIEAFFFFSIGAYFSLNNINLIKTVEKWKYVLVPLSVGLMIVTIIYDGTNTVVGQNVYPLFIITGVFTLFLIASKLTKRFNYCPKKIFVDSCFFVYASHVFIVPYVGSPMEVATKIIGYIPGTSFWVEIIRFFFVPFLTATFCLVIFSVLRRLFPRMTLIFSGNR